MISDTNASHPCVLLVEDDDAVREAVAEVMGDDGLPVVEAANGKAAVELLERLDEPPCCIVLDLMMPVMDGFELCRWLGSQSERLRSVPVVLLSASPRLQEAASALHVTAQLTKPISVETLLRTVHSLCRRAGGGLGPDLRAA